MNDSDFEKLQGRIIALEILMRGFIWNLVSEYDDPKSALERLKSGMLASLQHIERPLNESADATWGHAADALCEQFDAVAHRIASDSDK